mmetsp:Transcript_32572/g.51865  ORF Transcript_32572/g.51865 Transcript_32572/m.51865 type:complete len:618 (-) Transcript_32572:1489-3342(-)
MGWTSCCGLALAMNTELVLLFLLAICDRSVYFRANHITKQNKMFKCKHDDEPHCEFSDDSGMTCDGEKCASNELVAGEPLISCRECDQDLCVECGAFEKNKQVTGWTQEHVSGWNKSIVIHARGDVDGFGWTCVHWAAYSGCDSNLLDKYLEDHIDMCRLPDKMGQTPLMILCRKGGLDAVRAVCTALDLEDLAKTDEMGRNTLSHALLGGKIENCRELLKHVSDKKKQKQMVDIVDNTGLTLLMQAIIANRGDFVKVFLEHGADTNIKSVDGTTALVLAVQNDTHDGIEIIKCLVEHGAIVDARTSSDTNEMSALLICLNEGNLEYASWLVENADANIHATDADNCGAMYYAVKRPSSNDDEDEKEEDVIEQTKDFEACIEFVLSHGGEIDTCDNDGVTAFILACEQSDLTAAKKLFACGKIDVNKGSTAGNRPIHYASQKGNVELVKFLLEHGAKANVCNDAGFSVLHWAAQNKNSTSAEVMKLLINSGASATVSTCDEGMTPLHLASVFCSEEAVRVLIEAGKADVNAADNDGDTPLHNAAGKEPDGEDRVPVVLLLLEHGAEFKEKANAQGFTPLATAAAAENRQVAAILVKRGASKITLRTAEQGAAKKQKT